MNKCGMCGFFGECTHRKETDSAEDCNQYHDDYYVKSQPGLRDRRCKDNV